MREGTVIVDLSINGGGIATTSKVTNPCSPIYTVNNIIHYCVPNITSLVSHTASKMLTNAALPYILKIANLGVTSLHKYNIEIKNTVVEGKISNTLVKENV